MDDLEFQYYCPRLKRHVYFDFYHLLRIDQNATAEQIKKAYKDLARELHPDKCSAETKELSKEKFKIILGAYTTLIDPTKREAYDIFLKKLALKKNLKNGDLGAICSILKSCKKDNILDILMSSFCHGQVKFPSNFDTSSLNNFPPFDPSFLFFKQPNMASPTTTATTTTTTTTTNPIIMDSTETQSQCLPSQALQTNSTPSAPAILEGLSQKQDNSSQATSDSTASEQLTHHNLSFLEGNSGENSSTKPPLSPSPSCTSSTESFYSRFSFLSQVKNDQTPCFENFTFLKDIFNPQNRTEAECFSEDDPFYQRFKYMYNPAKQNAPNNSSPVEKGDANDHVNNSHCANNNNTTHAYEQDQNDHEIDMESYTEIESNSSQIAATAADINKAATACTTQATVAASAQTASLPRTTKTKYTSKKISNRHESNDDAPEEKIVKRIKSKQSIFKQSQRKKN